ncbi:related to ATP-binding cassette (ABC) transporter [Cephalotrichum gorgonifer]|uniref:Related to ATP-binding cassette (ABC) transporter n=1 Tax=Cephalotrichum gorgonifer TaxID=2041049 RepID=A0AAE8N6Y6_9PEZI|nr:related to ATP-binding cassette (ABC) transporter [Cephalotrichum gorgonifer]
MATWTAITHAIELVAPLGLYQLLAYIDNPQDAVLHPWIWLVVMLVGPLSTSVSFQQYIFTSTRLIVRIKSALTQELYHLALDSMELEPEDSNVGGGSEEKQTTTAAGRLANLLASDIEAVFEGRDILFVVIGSPLTVIIALVGLYQIIGWPTFVGGLILVASSLASLYTAKLMVGTREKVRNAQDLRMSLVSEYLALIRAVKYFAWEEFAIGRVQSAREAEQRHLWKGTLLEAMVVVINETFPYLAMLSIFGLRVFVQGESMTSSVAFTTVYLVQTIKEKLGRMAVISTSTAGAIVSFRRLDAHFERCRPLQKYPPGPPSIRSGTFGRSSTAAFRLRDIDLDFVEGGLNVITGQSGAGKTTLLLSLLGETIKDSGSVTRPPEIAYASQTSWLQGGTVRDNIVFPEAYEPVRYQEIIKACCLEPDLEGLPEGDRTVIGESGTSLSGGQRARVALARTLYSKAPMALLDDIFSALDAKTAARMWELCFCGDLLRGRTILLVTQVPWIAAQADLEIELEDGRVKKNEPHIGVVRTPVSIDIALATGEGLRELEAAANGDVAASPDGEEASSEDIVDAEMKTREAGRMIVGRYMSYFGNPAFTILAMVAIFASAASVTAGTLWLAIWTQAYNNDEAINIGLYLGVYAGIVLGEVALTNASVVMFRLGGWTAARAMHKKLIDSVMNVSLSWYTTTPVGRVINRFSRDIATLDDSLVAELLEVLQSVVGLVFRLGAIGSILPIFVVPSLISCVIGLVVGEMYTRTGVTLRRLSSSAQSPVFSQFGDTLAGLSVVRSRASVPDKFGNLLSDRLTIWSAATESLFNANRWVGMRVDFIGTLVSLGAGIIALYKSSTVASGLVGFSLLNATTLSGNILQLVRGANALEIEMQSFDRVEEYMALDHEEKPDDPFPEAEDSNDDGETAGFKIPRDWPRRGQIEFRDVTVRYEPDGQDILSNINLTIRAGERVAVVGRTGSGKSTLVLSLLRFTYIVSGTILYDGIDITKIPRRRLRQALTIIPQEPVLFSGTVESNLDCTGLVPREALQSVLDSTKHVASFQFRKESEQDGENGDLINQLEEEDAASGVEGLALSAPVTAKGENFSHGQRQVLSLCRALVQKNKVMLLDEATANMDYETDRAIQEVLGREVKAEGEERTLVTIAHRLRTIADYDTVVVMGAGKVLEVGSPRDLYRAEGDFYAMVKHSGEDEELRDM